MKFLKKLSTIQLLVLGYLFVITTIAVLLSLPISSASGQRQAFLDSFFVATSGISTTGLTPVDIGSFYSLFGQIVLLIDIQIGGLGYMAIFVFLALLMQAKLSMRGHLVASASVSGAYPGYTLKFFERVVAFTFIFEFIGGIILGFCWLEKFPLYKAFYFGFFHSINAFCTAGFGLLPDSLISFSKNIPVNLTIIFVSLIGGIGFYVINESYTIIKKLINRQMYRKLSIHSKLAVYTTLVLVLIGTIVFLVSENWDGSFHFPDRILISLFQAVTAQTTDGYNTVDIGKISSASLFMLVVLMFIGASPGSTGGGIKTTSIGTIYLCSKSYILGDKDVNFQKRRLPEDAIRKALAILFLFLIVCAGDMIILTSVEKFQFHQILFEIVSALGNVGLSTGITAYLNNISKLFLITTMFIGRVGPLTVSFALIGKRIYGSFRYPVEDVFIG